MKIARGLLSEDDYLLTEILFNPRTPHQIARIQEELDILQEIIKNKDSERMKEYLTKIRKNIGGKTKSTTSYLMGETA